MEESGEFPIPDPRGHSRRVSHNEGAGGNAPRWNPTISRLQASFGLSDICGFRPNKKRSRTAILSQNDSALAKYV